MLNRAEPNAIEKPRIKSRVFTNLGTNETAESKGSELSGVDTISI